MNTFVPRKVGSVWTLLPLGFYDGQRGIHDKMVPISTIPSSASSAAAVPVMHANEGEPTMAAKQL